MPEMFAEALALPGLWLLIFAAALAGLVRGFSGFGTAMIFLPFAAQVLPPAWAILVLIGMDSLGPIPVLPRAWRDSNRVQLSILLGCACLSLPLGVAALSVFAPETYRYIVSTVSIVLIVCLLSGLRYTGVLSKKALAGTGVAAGMCGGVAGVPGPPVILLYMSSQTPVAQVRGNMMLFLFIFEFLLLGVFAVFGQFALMPLVIGVVLAIPNGLGNLAGQWVFDPARANLYRGVAYVIVAASAILGLPIWD
ncbi:MAG: TSUP family transporter [Paracoccaceae bacterium]